MGRFDVPDEVVDVFHRFRTAELTTLGRDGTPATWPITVVYRPDSGEFVGATSIGLSQKAVNIRRNPRVSLLFSETRASALDHPPAVLVQGDAVADEVTTLDGIEDVWAKIYRFQPAARWTTWGPVMKALVGKWYYVRIPLRVSPTRILWWPGGDFGEAPVEATRVG